MIPVPTGVRVWLATGHTDMRKGFGGLSLLVQETLKRDPHSGNLFVFLPHNRTSPPHSSAASWYPAHRTRGAPLRLDAPFPLEELPPRVRQAILTEFGGRHPSIREVASIPDTHWLKLSGMGPRFVASMRSLTRGARRTARLPSFAGMTNSELQAKYDRLTNLRKAIDDQLKAVRAEVLLRSEANRTALDEPP
ncbi:IS66 family insertion sequence element accessory protein TnpB [Microvirga sp. 3-52]|nr:IS66 family insertion sequence element accessory protein TnpB [Microvirga sp. 3-52]